MRQKSQTRQTGADKAIKDIRRATRKQYSAEEKIRIVLDGLRGEETISELCRREGIPGPCVCVPSLRVLGVAPLLATVVFLHYAYRSLRPGQAV